MIKKKKKIFIYFIYWFIYFIYINLLMLITALWSGLIYHPYFTDEEIRNRHLIFWKFHSSQVQIWDLNSDSLVAKMWMCLITRLHHFSNF